MRAGINDLSFDCSFYDKNELMRAVSDFIRICGQVESVRCHNVDRLIGIAIDKTTELAPGHNLYHVIESIKNRNERTYFLGLLKNRAPESFKPDVPFALQGRESWLCASLKDEVLVSLESCEAFSRKEIDGTIRGEHVSIANISGEEHLYDHQELLGLRIYEHNDIKHKRDRENPYGKGRIGSPMDLSREEAQSLLDHAICVKGRLYARRGKHNYAFQNTRRQIYHGYIADDLGEDILKELSAVKWD